MNNSKQTYEERLMDFIINYTKEHKVPPSVDDIIKNLPERSSKSTVWNHLQKLTKLNKLTQQNIKGYYYPTCLIVSELPKLNNKTRKKELNINGTIYTIHITTTMVYITDTKDYTKVHATMTLDFYNNTLEENDYVI